MIATFSKAQQKEALELLEHARNALRPPHTDSAISILIDEFFVDVGYLQPKGEVSADEAEDDPFN